jgi:hypothetical protein
MMRLLIGATVLACAPAVAWAQQEVGPQDLTRTTADPVEKLVGLWRVDKVEGTGPANVASGQVLRIDRQSVATLTQGTCSNPSFDEKLGSITVACLGQDLASAAWNTEEPGTIQWSEGKLQANLRRISGTETLDSPPPAETGAVPAEEGPAEDDEGSEDAE